jgi:hypothetical protein
MRKLFVVVGWVLAASVAQAGDYAGVGVGAANASPQWSSGAAVSYAHTFDGTGVGVAVDYLNLGTDGDSVAVTALLVKPAAPNVMIFYGAGAEKISQTGLRFAAGAQFDGVTFSTRLTVSQSRIPGAQTTNTLTVTLGRAF